MIKNQFTTIAKDRCFQVLGGNGLITAAAIVEKFASLTMSVVQVKITKKTQSQIQMKKIQQCRWNCQHKWTFFWVTPVMYRSYYQPQLTAARTSGQGEDMLKKFISFGVLFKILQVHRNSFLLYQIAFTETEIQTLLLAVPDDGQTAKSSSPDPSHIGTEIAEPPKKNQLKEQRKLFRKLLRNCLKNQKLPNL